MSDEHEHVFTAARDALRQAREYSRWPTNNLNRNKRVTERLLTALAAHRAIPEVADFIERVQRDPTQVDSRELHYMQRRYVDGAALHDMDDMDALYRTILSDPDALMYRQAGLRYQVRSPRVGWIAVFDPDGTRISLYPDLDDNFGEPLWTLSTLIR